MDKKKQNSDCSKGHLRDLVDGGNLNPQVTQGQWRTNLQRVVCDRQSALKGGEWVTQTGKKEEVEVGVVRWRGRRAANSLFRQDFKNRYQPILGREGTLEARKKRAEVRESRGT